MEKGETISEKPSFLKRNGKREINFRFRGLIRRGVLQKGRRRRKKGHGRGGGSPLALSEIGRVLHNTEKGRR